MKIVLLPAAVQPTVRIDAAKTALTLLTTAPVKAGEFSGVCPEWGRTEDVRRHFGIKRGTLYNLLAQGKIRGKVLRVRGQLKGVRIWDMQSIRNFIESQPDSLGDNDNDRGSQL